MVAWRVVQGKAHVRKPWWLGGWCKVKLMSENHTSLAGGPG
uniref:Uncharacterized protein n=1 Tax=Picea glauca TaxID=3330 RepID=A0A101LTP7_PICGL|nr:hypothetical protein ABT39_MTgene3606 [Picea glauca]